MLFSIALCLTSAISLAQKSQIVYTDFIQSGNAKLFLEVRGAAGKSPIILFLHGGPGNAFGLISFRAYVGPQLESKFLIAYLHQRGVLESPTVPDSSQTVSNHIVDVMSALNYLKTKYPGRRLYILGHSWGGTLAMLSVIHDLQLVKGVIDVAGPFNFVSTLKYSYEMTLKWGKQNNISTTIEGLEKIGPPPYTVPSQQSTLSDLSSSAYGGIDKHLSIAKLLSRPPYTKMNPAWQKTQVDIISAMNSELNKIDMEPALSKIRTPLLVIVGDSDAVVPAESLKTGYATFGGPKKFVILKNSHHLPFVDQPDEFVKEIEEFVK